MPGLATPPQGTYFQPSGTSYPHMDQAMAYGAGGAFGQHSGSGNRVPHDTNSHPSQYHVKDWWNLSLSSDQQEGYMCRLVETEFDGFSIQIKNSIDAKNFLKSEGLSIKHTRKLLQ